MNRPKRKLIIYCYADLSGRAYSVAWHHNMLMMQYFNISTNGSYGSAPFSYLNSHLGKRYNISQKYGGLSGVQPNAIQTNWAYKALIEPPSLRDLSGNSSFYEPAENWPNPQNVTSDDFQRISMHIS